MKTKDSIRKSHIDLSSTNDMIDVDDKSIKSIETGRTIKDQLEKTLLSYPDVFAGICGAFFFEGSYDVKAEHLSAIDPVTLSLTDKARQSQRDVVMAWQEDSEMKAILMCENQTEIDAHEPVRILGYQADSYRHQIEADQKPTAIIKAIVLNYSDRRWQKHQDLSHLLEKLPQEVRGYFDVHAIKVIDVCFLSDEELEAIEGDFKGVALYLREIREKRQRNVLHMLEGNEVPLKHPKEVLLLLSEITKDDSYLEIYDSLKEKGEMTMISDAVKAIMSRGETIGYHSGYTEGEQSGYARGEQSGYARGEQSGYARGEQSGLKNSEKYWKTAMLKNLLSKKFPGCSFEWISELDMEKLSIIEDRFNDITYEEVMQLQLLR